MFKISDEPKPPVNHHNQRLEDTYTQENRCRHFIAFYWFIIVYYVVFFKVNPHNQRHKDTEN